MVNTASHYSAPWSPAVKVITTLSLTLLLGVSLYGAVFFSRSVTPLVRLAISVLPLAVIVGTLPFLVRGFLLGPGELRIQRLGWQNRFRLKDITSVELNAEALRGSIRLCGSGGLFGFFGWFRNRTLGLYRAYGTDPKLAVILRMHQRTIVVTPEDPQRFVAELEALRNP